MSIRIVHPGGISDYALNTQEIVLDGRLFFFRSEALDHMMRIGFTQEEAVSYITLLLNDIPEQQRYRRIIHGV